MTSQSLRLAPIVAVSFLAAVSTGATAGSSSNLKAGFTQGATLQLACDSSSAIEVEDSRGVETGNGMRILTSVLARHQMNANFTQLPRKRGIVGAASGKYDGLCSCLSSERLGGSFYYSEPLGQASIGAISSKDDVSQFQADNGENLGRRGLNWGVVASDGLRDLLKQRGVRNYALLDSHEQGFQMLELGRIDVLLAHKSTAFAHVINSSSPSRYSYQELMRPSFHLCLTGARGKRIIEALNVTLKKFTSRKPVREVFLK
jgi:ABC-type amino acid transport substrate-binding protein